MADALDPTVIDDAPDVRSTSRVRPDRGARTGPGRRRSASTTSSPTSSGWPSRGSTATTSTGSRAGRPRAGRRVLVRRVARRHDRRPDTGRRSTSGRASTSTAAARTSWPAAPSSSRTSPTGGCTGSTPVTRRPVAITPEGPSRYADLRFDPARRRFLAVREDHGGEGEPPVAADRRDRRSTASDEPHGPRRGPRLPRRRRGCRPTAATLAWLEWDHPDMPWDATRLRVAPVADGRDARAVRPRRRRPGGVDRPAASGRPTASLHLDQRPERLVEPLPAGRGSAAGAARPTMEAEFADPAWIFDRSSYGFLPDGSIVAIARSEGRDRLVHVQPGRLVGEVASAFTEFDGLRVGADDGRRAGRLADRGRRCSSRSTRRPWRRPGSCGDRPRRELDPARSSRSRSRSASRRPTAGSPTPCSTRPTNPRSRGPGRGAAAARRADRTAARRRNASTRARPRDPAADQPRHRRGRRRLRREHRLRPRRTASALDGEWGVVDVDDCVAAARFLVERGDVDPDRLAIEGGSAGGYTTLAALAFRDVFAAGISCSASATSRACRARHAQVRVALHRPARRAVSRRRPPSTASARRSTTSTRSPARSSSCRASTTRSCRPTRPRRSSPRSPPTGSRTPTSRSRARATGSAAPTAIRRTLEAELAFLGAVFGFEPAGDIEPMELPRPRRVARAPRRSRQLTA